jgi:hypothetical protein
VPVPVLTDRERQLTRVRTRLEALRDELTGLRDDCHRAQVPPPEWLDGLGGQVYRTLVEVRGYLAAGELLDTAETAEEAAVPAGVA